MGQDLSLRLAACINALPLRQGMRVLEIGCGPEAAAREVSRRIGDGFVLAQEFAVPMPNFRCAPRADILMQVKQRPVGDFAFF